LDSRGLVVNWYRASGQKIKSLLATFKPAGFLGVMGNCGLLISLHGFGDRNYDSFYLIVACDLDVLFIKRVIQGRF
jgi:hypothetical protein